MHWTLSVTASRHSVYMHFIENMGMGLVIVLTDIYSHFSVMYPDPALGASPVVKSFYEETEVREYEIIPLYFSFYCLFEAGDLNVCCRLDCALQCCSAGTSPWLKKCL